MKVDWEQFGLKWGPDTNGRWWKFILRATDDRGLATLRSFMDDRFPDCPVKAQWPFHDIKADIEGQRAIIFYIRIGPLFVLRLVSLFGSVYFRAKRTSA